MAIVEYKNSDKRDFLEGLEKAGLLYMYLVSLVSSDELLTVEDCEETLKELDYCLEILPENNLQDSEKIRDFLIKGKEIVNQEVFKKQIRDLLNLKENNHE